MISIVVIYSSLKSIEWINNERQKMIIALLNDINPTVEEMSSGFPYLDFQLTTLNTSVHGHYSEKNN